ncbi:hypothetical protein E0K63_23825, partial [Escherichia coli]
SHWSTSKTPSYTKSVSWHHHLACALSTCYNKKYLIKVAKGKYLPVDDQEHPGDRSVNNPL